MSSQNNWNNIAYYANESVQFVCCNLVKKPVSWIVFKGLKAEGTRDNEWVVTIVSTFLIVFLIFQLICLMKRIIYSILSRLTWKNPLEKQPTNQADLLPKNQPFPKCNLG